MAWEPMDESFWESNCCGCMLKISSMCGFGGTKVWLVDSVGPESSIVTVVTVVVI